MFRFSIPVKYSLLIVIAAVAIVAGSVLGWMKYERWRLLHKAEVYSSLDAKGVIFGGPEEGWPRPNEQMQTWRGDESLDYIYSCGISNTDKINAKDIDALSSAFPTIGVIKLFDCQPSGEQLRKLAALPKLKTLTLVRSPIASQDMTWIKANFPRVEVEQIQCYNLSRQPDGTFKLETILPVGQP